ncbi:hypothetical protein BAL199_22127 [alpha proteobacterium BAL199]|nr:hypothetical protein BAL199_22127 [alpha proteobacterium BAL199]
MNTPTLATPVRQRSVLLITDDQVHNGPDGPTARLASTRLRLLVALRALNDHGHRATLVANTTPEHIESARNFADADHIVIGKVFQDYRALADHARRRGKIVTLDVTDDLARYRTLAPMHALTEYADAFTASSEGLAALARTWTKTDAPSYRVDDPFADVFQPVGGSLGRRPLRLVWFGSPTNARYLNPQMPGLIRLAGQLPLELSLVSTGVHLFQGLMERYRDGLAGLTVRYSEWSPDNQRQELKHADLVILPGDLDADSALKSANRLITAIAAGRFCVASPLPAYEALSDYAMLVDDLATGIEAAAQMVSADVDDAIRSGQEFIARAYSPALIGKRWVEILTQVGASVPRP